MNKPTPYFSIVMGVLLAIFLSLFLVHLANAKDCEAGRRAEWSNGPHKCISDGDLPAMTNGAPAALRFQTEGSAKGYILEKCEDGKRVVQSSFCYQRCINMVSVFTEKCSYEYKPGRKPMAAGESIAVGSGRCAARLLCDGGDIRLVK